MTVPSSDARPDLQIVRGEAPRFGGSPGGGSVPEQALGLLDHAQRVAESTVAEARAEAERLLGAARERATQLQHDARELSQRLRDDAERESAEMRHRAQGEAERIVADARTRVGQLEGSIDGLRSTRDQTLAAVRQLHQRLAGALGEHDGDPQS